MNRFMVELAWSQCHEYLIKVSADKEEVIFEEEIPISLLRYMN